MKWFSGNVVFVISAIVDAHAFPKTIYHAIFGVTLEKAISTRADLMAFLDTRGACHATVPSGANLFADICITFHSYVRLDCNLLTILHTSRTGHITFSADATLSTIRGFASHGSARAGNACLLAVSCDFTWYALHTTLFFVGGTTLLTHGSVTFHGCVCGHCRLRAVVTFVRASHLTIVVAANLGAGVRFACHFFPG